MFLCGHVVSGGAMRQAPCRAATTASVHHESRYAPDLEAGAAALRASVMDSTLPS